GGDVEGRPSAEGGRGGGRCLQRARGPPGPGAGGPGGAASRPECDRRWTRHQLGRVIRTGRLDRPRSVLLYRRFGSPVISIEPTLRASALSTTSPSRRASVWPTHTWMPAPKPTWPTVLRLMS